MSRNKKFKLIFLSSHIVYFTNGHAQLKSLKVSNSFGL